MWLRMDYIKAEVKKKLKQGKKYYLKQEVSEGAQKSITWDSYIRIIEFYHGHVLCCVNGLYRTSYTYMDLFEKLQNGGIK